jgi:hypothetical protein
MKVWIAVVALLLLLALVVRERFETYEQALKDVGQSSGYITPKCPEGYTMNSEQSSCEKTKPDGTKEVKQPECPSGSGFVKRGNRGVCEPTAESPQPQPQPQTNDTEQRRASSNQTSGRSCPDGYTSDITGQCINNATGETLPRPSGSETTSVPAPSETPATTTPVSSTTATTTGGTSGNLFGPNSGGVGKSGKNVWGPIFTGQDTSRQETGGDSTKSNKYPDLLGGIMGKQSARIDGVGIIPPSQFGLDLGVLPSSSSLGTDANARFLPFARQPGDTDFSADPYRLAKSYSTKNYSPQAEPVPFLTDFSAFFK